MAITNPTKYVTVRRLERFKAKINLLNPLSLPDLAHNYEFKKNDALAIGGIIYRCTANSTTKPPFDFVFDENNKIVYTELNGQRAYTADSATLNTGWEVYFDLQDRFYIEDVRQGLLGDIAVLRTAVASKQDTLVFDEEPTEDSENMLDSGTVFTALSEKVPLSQKGTAGGVAELDENGKVLSSQLPSYVDDVIEAYYNPSDGKFYAIKSGTTYSDEITGESGKIYVDLSTEKTYRWGGSSYVEISPSLALCETSSTAYRGDRGKTAYDHSQSAHARTDATKTEASQTNGNIKINGTETNVYTHPSGTNPHGTTKSDVGLGNVGNFKAVSTEASQGLSDTEKSNARANIGAGTYSKASGGIPKTDLESAVQTSLGKADSALQSHQDISGKADKSATVSTVVYDTTNKKLTKTINSTTTDIVTALKLAQDAGAIVVNMVDLSTVTHNYTFKKYDGLCIDGVLYRCTADTTTKPPFDFVFDSDNKIVYDTFDGEDVFLVDSNTLNTGWEKYLDLSDRLHIDQVRENLQENIDQVQRNLDRSVGIAYAVCGTEGSEAAKEVAIANFNLIKNRAIAVLFVDAFTATSPTLNVNGTGAKAIKYFGNAIAPGKVRSNTILTMQYDGTSWNVVFIQPQAAVPSMAVDLGLPSGLLWADRNVGAVTPEDPGRYFAWGDTDGHAADSGYNFSQGNYDASDASAINTDLSLTNDTARANIGSQWRMPSKSEYLELKNNCRYEWTKQNGIFGMRFTSNLNGNSIFIPASGYFDGTANTHEGETACCMTSSISNDPTTVSTHCMWIAGGSAQTLSLETYRYLGAPVRAVM